MKKIIALLLAVTMLACLTACLSGTSDPTGNVQTHNPQAPVENEDPTGSAGQSHNNSNPADSQPVGEKVKTTVEETVLVDSNGVKITATGFSDDGIFGPELKLLVENNTSKNITVQSSYCVVNGYMVESSMSIDVVAGKKANSSLSLMQSNISLCGIEKVAEITFELHYFDSDTWEDIADCGEFTVTTSEYDDYTQVYDDSGFLAFEANGVKMVAKGVIDDGLFGPELVFYIENNTENYITISARDLSVNGFMVESSFYAELLPGTKSFDSIVFMSSSLQENSIESINNVEFYISVYDTNTWEDYFESEIISLDISYED